MSSDPKLTAHDLAVARALAKEEGVMDELVMRGCGRGVLVARSHTLFGEPFPERPSLKVTATLRHTDGDVAALVAALRGAVEEVLG